MCPPDVPAARGSVPLNRQQLTDFIQDGLIVVQPSVPRGDAFHEHIWEAAEDLYRTGEFGNNLLSTLPALDAVLDAPEITGALTALLGEDYVLQAHRHCHVAMAEGAGNQHFHQDGFDGFRHMAPTDLMVMYYPQAVTESMGPTAVLPGSQYYREKPNRNERRVTLDRPGGCVIMHFHLWHSATARLQAGKARYMFKFQFRRSRPFLPLPGALWPAIEGENPFAPQGSLSFSGHSFACAAVWSMLSGVPLSPQVTTALCSATREDPSWTELAAACGALPFEELLGTFLCALSTEEQSVRHADHAGKHPLSATSQLPNKKVLLDAAGALQVCTFRDGAGTLVLTNPKATMMVHPDEQEWILEVLLALPVMLPIDQLLMQLLPLVAPAQCVRTQTRAIMGIYVAGIACGAPCSAVWCDAVSKVPLEETLLTCIESWQSFLQQVKGAMPPRELTSGRYTLAEALRCVGRFCSAAAASKAAHLIGATDRTDLFFGPNWRERFARYVDRRRRCPITSLASLF